MMSAVQGKREYVCAGCAGVVLTIAALRQLAPDEARALWTEEPEAVGGPAAAGKTGAAAGEDGAADAGPAHCPFCGHEMQAKAVAAGQAALCRPCEAVWLDNQATHSVQVRDAGPQPDLSSETLRCPQCGAPVASSSAENCQYCGASLHAPVKVVVLPQDEPGGWGARGRSGGVVTEILGTFLRDRL